MRTSNQKKKTLVVQLDPGVAGLIRKYAGRFGISEEQLASDLLNEYVERMALMALATATREVWSDMWTEERQE
jgi:hypothetical protein